MVTTVETKQTIVKSFQKHEKDTGSSEVQIALLTQRISYLTEHPEKNIGKGIIIALCAIVGVFVLLDARIAEAVRIQQRRALLHAQR